MWDGPRSVMVQTRYTPITNQHRLGLSALIFGTVQKTNSPPPTIADRELKVGRPTTNHPTTYQGRIRDMPFRPLFVGQRMVVDPCDQSIK